MSTRCLFSALPRTALWASGSRFLGSNSAVKIPEFTHLRELSKKLRMDMQEVLRALGGSRARKKIQIKFREQDNVERNFVFKDVPKEVIIPFQAARDLAEMQGFSVEKMNTEPRIPWEQIKEEDRGTPGNLTEIRPPIAVLLGHYNHGKTTLLDRFRGGNSKLVAEELCGITQEIRAVNIHDAKHRFKVTLIDTPGQDIFYGMRSRGVGIADFAILVVSAVDGICQQTEECIGWIQEWNIPTVVALNKMDIAPKKQIETLVAQLKEFECLDKSCIVPLSARTGDGLDDLRTAMQKLMGNLGVIKSSALENLEPHCTVLDVRKNEGVGHEFLLIVKTGIVRQKNFFLTHLSKGRIRSIHDPITGVPMKLGLPGQGIRVVCSMEGRKSDVPIGEPLYILPEKFIDLCFEVRSMRTAYEHAKEDTSPLSKPTSLTMGEGYENGEEGENEGAEEISGFDPRVVHVVLRTDIGNTLITILDAIEELHPQRVQVAKAGVGLVTLTDVFYASEAGTPVLGFNTRVARDAKRKAKELGVEILLKRTVQEVIDEISDLVDKRDAELQSLSDLPEKDIEYSS